MVTYPIHVSRDSYRGSNPKKRAKAQATNQLASSLEAHINKKLQNQSEPIRVYMYQELALETGIAYDAVRKLGFSIDGGSGGFTAYKSGLTQEQAMDIVAKRNRT
ncbi:MAG: hypothetical protein SGJ20_01360 [Planctomycetota bacterium]|nr:hypothetical protein [Planctomycetota bacterium]